MNAATQSHEYAGSRLPGGIVVIHPVADEVLTGAINKINNWANDGTGRKLQMTAGEFSALKAVFSSEQTLILQLRL